MIFDRVNLRVEKEELEMEYYDSLVEELAEEPIIAVDSDDTEISLQTIRKDFRETWIWELIDGYARAKIHLVRDPN